MPNPTRAQLHVDTPLTNVSIAYQQSTDDFIAMKVAPIVPVAKQSDKYYIFDIGDAFRSQAARRAPGTESAGTGWRTSTTTYFADKWSVHQDIPDEDRANADAVFDLNRDATNHITHDMLIAREVDWAATCFTTSVWTGSTTAGDITPGNLWSVVASTPIADVRAQATSIRKKTGQRPNTLVLGIDVFDKLADHEDLLDRIKYTQEGSVTEALLARVFRVDNVYVAEATRNTGAEEGTDSMAFINGSNDALLCHVAKSPGIRVPSAMYTFAWNAAGANSGTRIKNIRMDELDSDRIEIDAYFDHKVIGADCGVFFSNVVS